ncbi:ATP-binding protein [Aquamicrobium defluvii]|uniref:ATP-binding protein n=1 Tax=Aquamicrobium defluvii TaxID=69279 RepID=UPI002477D23D|nr:ATP-binding protein [Aquamicrobium defluvii]
MLDREGSWATIASSPRLHSAKLRRHAIPEDVDYRSERGLDRALFLKLIAGHWIAARDNLAICGRSSVGKSWLDDTVDRGRRQARSRSS